ncbi:small ribosomal subunit protein mS37 [Rhodnius prolixus]
MKKLGYVKRGCYITPDKVPFKELLPLKLKTSVSGKGDKNTGASCVQEMSVLFACLKRNGFNDIPCNKEVTAFRKCWEDNAAQQRLKKTHERQGVLVPGEKNLSHKQIDELLKRYPGN